MEEIEVPLENLQEEVHHHAAHGGGGKNAWIMQGALLSAILAVFAAIAALLAGHYANEAMLEQLKAADHWNYYQSKGIKASVLEGRRDILEVLGKPADPKIETKLDEYKNQQKEIADQAKEKESESEHHLEQHQVLARAVTFFQIAIAVTAIAVLVGRRRFLLLAIVFGTAGLAFLIQGYFFTHSGL